MNRQVFVNHGLTSEGRKRKSWAKANRRCVTCEGVLKRGLYCSSSCYYDFLGNPLYHRGIDDWTLLREKILGANRECALCREPATEVHHIKPIVRGGREFDPENLQPLCRRHHVEQTKNLARILAQIRLTQKQEQNIIDRKASHILLDVFVTPI